MKVHVLRAVAVGVLLALGILWWLLPRGVAELVATVGSVERDHASAIGRFSAATRGAVFEIGDGVRTAGDASADVTLSAGPLLKVRAATLVRFRGTRGGSARVELSHGEVSIFTVEEPVLLETAAGLVRVAPRSRAVLREQGGQTWVDVVLGRAELEWASTTRREVNAGESARYDQATRLTQVVTNGSEPRAPAPAKPTPTSASDAAALEDAAAIDALLPGLAAPGANAVQGTDAGAASGATDATPVSMPDVMMTPADALTLLDAAPPTLVGFSTPGCASGAATLEVEQKGRYGAVRGLVHAFDVGATRYRLRCGAKLLQAGRVRVVKDAGHRPLAELPPENQIEADGRAYTVLYQTRLPNIRVRWSSGRGQSQLVVESGAARQVFPASGGQADVPSGALSEGAHKLWFEQPGTDARSRTTMLEIRFDNATPLARLSEDSVPLADGSMNVSGIVVTGARVSVRGEAVALDAAGRFRTLVHPSADARGFAVKVELPKRSVVYYVRRFRAAIAIP